MGNVVRRLGNLGALAKLGGGSAAGQAAVMLASPILTRFYPVAMFGEFGVFSALSTGLGTLASLRFEQAIILQDSEDAADAILRLCVVCSGAIAAMVMVSGIVILALGAFGLHGVRGFVSILSGATSVFGLGIANGLLFWFTRKGAFGTLGVYQFSRSALAVLLQLGLYLMFGIGQNLVLGQTLGICSAVFLMIYLGAEGASFRNFLPLFRNFSFSEFRGIVQRYRHFAIFGAPQYLARLIAVSMPPVLLPLLFNAAEAGLYWLAYRILVLPSQIFVESARGVLFKQISDLHRAGIDIRPAILRNSAILGVLSLLIGVSLIVFGPALFGFVFGAPWRRAGLFASAIALGWIFENAAVSSAIGIVILEQQKPYLFIESIALLGRLAALFVGFKLHSAIYGVLCASGVVAMSSLATIIYIQIYLGNEHGTLPARSD